MSPVVFSNRVLFAHALVVVTRQQSSHRLVYRRAGNDKKKNLVFHSSWLLATRSSNEDSSDREDSWSIGEDWNARSQSENGPVRSQDIFHQDIVGRAAFYMQQQQQSWNVSSIASNQDEWMQQALDEIHTTSEYDIDDDHDHEASDGESGSGFDNLVPMDEDSDDQLTTQEEIMDHEITQLIRCNQDPMQFLIQQGRALAPLTETELHHVRQLVTLSTQENQADEAVTANTAFTGRQSLAVATPFFRQAIRDIFEQHATVARRPQSATSTATKAAQETTESSPDENKILDAKSVASWLQQSLSIPSTRCGPHDPRVQHILSKYGRRGQLDLADFESLYLQAVVGPPSRNRKGKSGTTKTNQSSFKEEMSASSMTSDAPSSDAEQEEEEFYLWLRLIRSYEIDQVWNDMEMHDIEPPAYTEYRAKLLELQRELAANGSDGNALTLSGDEQDLLFHDECDIEESYGSNGKDDHELNDSWKKDDKTGVWTNTGKSSHELIKLCSIGNDGIDVPPKDDKKKGQEKKLAVPLRFKDGDFVYIDEESCIGCMQCALAAPSSFRMIPSSGRARTFVQDTSPAVAAAVSSCPVNCMYYVGFDRLVELERARDHHEFPSSIQHHRHFGARYQHQAGSQQGGGGRNSRLQTEATATQWIGHTPMYVSRMESSDANHKESIYHYIRNQCYKSSACPQKGCYDCPMYKSDPEANPNLARKRREANHIRAQHFIKTGVADAFRNTADL